MPSAAFNLRKCLLALCMNTKPRHVDSDQKMPTLLAVSAPLQSTNNEPSRAPNKKLSSDYIPLSEPDLFLHLTYCGSYWPIMRPSCWRAHLEMDLKTRIADVIRQNGGRLSCNQLISLFSENYLKDPDFISMTISQPSSFFRMAWQVVTDGLLQLMDCFVYLLFDYGYYGSVCVANVSSGNSGLFTCSVCQTIHFLEEPFSHNYTESESEPGVKGRLGNEE
ncbi:hypothetical protein CLF_112199 [Clonorchis sinensis]|uniref:Uncharacterized protein n=1 Tax=Clonorchis sinensis TaxID=79923 RepID=G7YVY4_CLOSI|nr:hypothetical protein CLF_112199 [Clonorchis sinensis]